MEDNNQFENLVRELTFKVIIIGNQGVGKTSIINRGVDPNYEFQDIAVPATRVSERSLTIQIQGYDIILKIWDAPGEHQPTDYRPDYFRNVDAVIMVYDLTNMESFTFVKNLMPQLRRLCNKPLKEIALFITGNKSDLPIDQLEVHNNVAESFSDQHGATLFVTSALSNSNIRFLFQTIALHLSSYYINSKKRNEGCLLI